MDQTEENVCYEHDYTTKFEVPLEAIKTEILDEDESEEQQVLSDSTSPTADVTRVPIVLRDNKPKLRKKKQSLLLPKRPPVLSQRPIMPKTNLIDPNSHLLTVESTTVSNKGSLPRPIMPKIDLPPPTPPNLKCEPPPNCKGVLIVQDVKFCTMYVPKSGNAGNGTPVHSFPIGAISKSIAAQAPPAVLNPNAAQTLLSAQKNPATASDASDIIPAAAHTMGLQKGLPQRTRRDSSKVDHQPFSVMVSQTADLLRKSPCCGLLEDVQKLLCGMLPMYWFSALETEGINVMLMSFGKEKAIQRRVYVSYGGNVEISVHCKSLPDYLVEHIMEIAGTKIRLTNTTVRKFSEWVVKVVNVLRDYQICLGLERHEQSANYAQSDDIVPDDNPYQECRYTQTLRSKNCIRIVHAGKRRCSECSKSFSLARKRTNQGSLTNQKKKVTVSSDKEFGELDASEMFFGNEHNPSHTLDDESVTEDTNMSLEKDKSAGTEKGNAKSAGLSSSTRRSVLRLRDTMKLAEKQIEKDRRKSSKKN